MADRSRAGLSVAFGGGTARAIAQVGALLVLEEEGLAPSAVAGTSFGAIVAALYALHGSAAVVRDIVVNQRTNRIWRQAFDFGLHQASLIHGQRLERWLDEEVFRGATFSDVQLPLVIACTELAGGNEVLLRRGSLARAVVASSALPGLLAPIEVDGQFLVDGGFIEAVPFQAAQVLGNRLILGLHAGIDTEHSWVVHFLQRMARWQPARRAVHWAGALNVAHPVGRLGRGLVWAGRSYLRSQPVPAGAVLLRLNPRVAWWDFHRAAQAAAEGEMTMQQLLASSVHLRAALADLKDVAEPA